MNIETVIGSFKKSYLENMSEQKNPNEGGDRMTQAHFSEAT